MVFIHSLFYLYLFPNKILITFFFFFLDIVFCRTWYKVDIPQLYNPITSLLLPKEKKNQWTGMKTLGELKREQNIKIEPNTDNLYTVSNFFFYNAIIMQ